MSVRPLHDILIVEKEEASNISPGGIIMTANHKPCIGGVESIGPGARDSSGNLLEHNIKEGDRVVWFTEEKEELITVNSTEMLTLRVSHLLGVIDSNSPAGVRPLHNILVVDKEEDKHHSAGGIYLPEGDDSPSMGTVLDAGPGVVDEDGVQHPIGVKPGDRIAWLYSHQKTFDIDGKDVIMVIGNGVLGIL